MESEDLLKLKADMELRRLASIQQTFKDALTEYMEHHPFILTSGEKAEAIEMLNWLFSGEMDYLQRNPKDYFELL